MDEQLQPASPQQSGEITQSEPPINSSAEQSSQPSQGLESQTTNPQPTVPKNNMTQFPIENQYVNQQPVNNGWSNSGTATSITPQTIGKTNFLTKIKMFLMRWMPFTFLFDFISQTILFLTLAIPLLLFSLATVWAGGVLNLLWTVFFLIYSVVQIVIAFIAYRATYLRKPNAYSIVRVAIFVSLGDIILNYLAGQGIGLNTILSGVILIVTFLAINEYRNYFDSAVSGEKGITMGPVAPSKKEKTVMYVMFGGLLAFMTVTMLFLGLIMTIISGGAFVGSGIISPFGKVSRSGIDYNRSSNESGTKTDNSVNSVSDIERNLIQQYDDLFEVNVLWPKQIEFGDSVQSYEFKIEENEKDIWEVSFRQDNYFNQAEYCGTGGGCSNATKEQLKTVDGIADYWVEKWKNEGDDTSIISVDKKKIKSNVYLLTEKATSKKWGITGYSYGILIQEPGDFSHTIAIVHSNSAGFYNKVSESQEKTYNNQVEKMVNKIANSVK